MHQSLQLYPRRLHTPSSAHPLHTASVHTPFSSQKVTGRACENKVRCLVHAASVHTPISSQEVIVGGGTHRRRGTFESC